MGRLGKVGGSVDSSLKTDKMIVDDNVQKTRGFSPNMAQFLINDANKIMQSNKNEAVNVLPIETTTVRDWGEPAYQGGFTGDTRKIANPHSTRYYTVGKK